MSEREETTPGPWKWFNYPDGRKLLVATNRAVIHCPDAPMGVNEPDKALIAASPEMAEALRVILATVRGDEHSECWTIRKFLDARDVFNDDISGAERLIEEVCKLVIAKALPPSQETP